MLETMPKTSAAAATPMLLARAALAQAGCAALLVYNSDPHLSEYLPERWKAREWLSGFPASAGIVALTATRAALFVDSRYLVLAEQAMAGSEFEVHLIGPADWSPHVTWIESQLAPGARVLTDGDVLAVAEQRQLQARLTAAGMELRTDTDVFIGIWHDRPAVPAQAAWLHAPAQDISSAQEKLARLRDAMAAQGASHHFISALDDIAWLTNLRGEDIEHNPFFAAHLLVAPDEALLFSPDRAFDAAAVAVLDAAGVRVRPYDEAKATLAGLAENAAILVDPKRITWGFLAAIPPACRIVEGMSPVTLAKRIKCPAEIDLFRQTMIEDGIALCRFHAEFEEGMARGESWNEWRVHERLTAMRALSPQFRGLSFQTSAAFGPNAALPHYGVARETALPIDRDGLLLIDSGGQYVGGTTDVCRVWAIGQPSAAMRRDATLAMRALIALSSAVFPAGYPGPLLDSIARAPLWAEGLNYFHGTGHGVGSYLGVHELPTLLSGRTVEPGMEYLPGIVTSIEPGVYRTGQWGVRHENIAVVVNAGSSEFGSFARFETLTLCPFDRRCLDIDALAPQEIGWLDVYHAEVRDTLAPRLEGRALQWLLENTASMNSA